MFQTIRDYMKPFLQHTTNYYNGLLSLRTTKLALAGASISLILLFVICGTEFARADVAEWKTDDIVDTTVVEDASYDFMTPEKAATHYTPDPELRFHLTMPVSFDAYLDPALYEGVKKNTAYLLENDIYDPKKMYQDLTDEDKEQAATDGIEFIENRPPRYNNAS